LLYLSTIALAFTLPLAFWFMWLMVSIVAVGEFVPKYLKNGFKFGPETENNWHLLNGRTTIQKTFDAEVEANAIASALNKHR